MIGLYAEMRSQLQAEEHLALLNLLTVGGSVQVKEPDYQGVVRDLERRSETQRPKLKATAADLAALGITVEHHPPKEQ